MERPAALLFDVFGTIVDWRGSLIADLTTFGQRRGIVADGRSSLMRGPPPMHRRWNLCAKATDLGPSWTTFIAQALIAWLKSKESSVFQARTWNTSTEAGIV